MYSSPAIGEAGSVFFGSSDRKFYVLDRGLTLANSSWPMFRGDSQRTGRLKLALNDGISDVWRRQFFGLNYATDLRALAVADPDDDGANNFQEFRAGTNPLDAKSINRVPLSISTWAGSTVGDRDGFRTEAQWNIGSDIVPDGTGGYWLIESSVIDYAIPGPGNHRLRHIDANGLVTTVAGAEAGNIDGPGNVARFSTPSAVVRDSKGNLFIVDRTGHRIRKVDLSGNVSTFAGSGRGYRDGVGPTARFDVPMDLAFDASDNLYVADWFNLRIRKITPQGVVSTYSGSERGSRDGDRLQATYDGPVSIARACPK